MVGAATSAITGSACSPYGFHWAFDTRALAVGTGGAGGDTWFFLATDYAIGYALKNDTSEIVTHAGGKVVGSVRVPLNSSDFSSFLLQAQSSKAKIMASPMPARTPPIRSSRRPSSASSGRARSLPAS